MTTSAPTLPPPLSAPPSTATLQGLLEALQQPVQRGVPTPPTPGRVFEQVPPAAPSTTRDDGSALDLTGLEELAASRQVIESARRGEATAPDGVPAPPDASGPAAPTPALTWSAGRVHHHHHQRRAAAVAAVVVAAGAVATFVGVGELVLP